MNQSSRIIIVLLMAGPLLGKQLPAEPDIALLEKPFLYFGKSAASTSPPDASTRGFDVKHYTLDLRIDPDAESLSGRIDIELQMESPAPQRVLLDLISTLRVDSLAWNGTPANWEHPGDSLWVTLPDAADVGMLSVWYHGQPLPQQGINTGMLFRNYGSSRADPEGLGHSIFTISEPWSANSWWPCKDHPSDKATATIALTVPDSLRAVANGILVSEAPADTGWTRFVWEETYPLSTYLIGLAISDYEEWTQDCVLSTGTLPLSFHIFPPDETAAGIDLSRTCDMVGFLENICGPDPFMSERYGQMEVKWGGAMEHQTSTSLGQLFLPGTGYYEQVIVHELAHQWFGNLQTPAAWSDIWLNEGFTSYFQALWIEYDQGHEAYLERMDRFGPGNPGHATLFADEGILTDPWPILPNLLIYHKGAWVLHMLRGTIGDTAFFSFLNTYITDPTRAYGHVSTADMITAAEAAAGRDLSSVLDPWLFTSAVPQIIWGHRETVLSANRFQVDIFVAQEQDTLFELHLPLRIKTAGSDLDTLLILSTTNDSLKVVVDSTVEDVILDPEGWVLMNVQESPSAYPPPIGSQPTADISLLPINPNPSDGRDLNLAFRLHRSGRIFLNVYDVLGRQRDSQDLGSLSAREEPYLRIWKPIDHNGHRLASGCYWLEIKVAGQRDVRKVLILR